ncbi:MAG: Na/Pi cotransporter family protein, partial [Acidimicrobiia bacterium]|nr:Na/Pi cotransporter family protein [Acidimicrobiia bacterium]
GEETKSFATPQEFANAHTIFNAVNTVAFIALLTPLVQLTGRLVPAEVGERTVGEAQPAYLDRALLNTPVLALEVARKEVMRLALKVRGMFADSVPAALSGTRRELAALHDVNKEVDSLHGAIVGYLGETSRGELSSGQREEFRLLLQVTNELEHMANLIDRGVIAVGGRRIDDVVEVSDRTRQTLRELHDAVTDTLDNALEALGTGNVTAAKRVAESKAGFHELEGSATVHLADRLTAPDPQRVQAYSVEIELVEGLRRVHQSCRRIARVARRAADEVEKIDS